MQNLLIDTTDPFTEQRAAIVRRLCPRLSQAEQDEAAHRLYRYVDLLCRVARRIASDPVALSEFQRLTRDVPISMIPTGRLTNQSTQQ